MTAVRIRMQWASATIVVQLLLRLFFFVGLANALHESDVGVVDWHKRLVGVPLFSTSATEPAFQHIPGAETDLILTVTANNVFAVLNATDGAVAWRYVFDPKDRIAGFYRHENAVVTLSGSGASILRVFDTLTGHLTLEKHLQDMDAADVSQPHRFAQLLAFDKGNTTSLYALTNGRTVTKFDLKTRETLWKWSVPEEARATQTTYSHIVATSTITYLVGISKLPSGHTLHIIALDPSDGAVLTGAPIPSNVKDAESYLVLSPTSDTLTPHILWLDSDQETNSGLLKSLSLSSVLQDFMNSSPAWLMRKDGSKTNFVRFSNVGLANHGYIIAVEQEGTEYLVGVEEKGVKSFWEIKPEKAEGTSETLWAGGVDSESGEVVLSRVYWVGAAGRIKVETFRASGSEILVRELTMFIPFDTISHGIVSYARLYPNLTARSASLLLVTGTGAIQLWKLDTALSDSGLLAAPRTLWTREESLANVAVAEFVDLPEGKSVDEESKGLGKEEGFVARVLRQAVNAKDFPQYVVQFINRFVSGSTPSSVPAAATTSEQGSLVRDPFGFRQILVVATMHGKVFGIDASNGNVLWSRIFGLGWASEIGGTVHPVKIYSGFGKGEQAREVVIVTQRRASNTLVDSVIFHIDALTGANARAVGEKARAVTQGFLEGYDIVQGPMVDIFLLDPSSDADSGNQKKSKKPKKGKGPKSEKRPPTSKVVLVLDEYLQVYPYPNTPEAQATLDYYADKIYFPLMAETDDGTSVPGVVPPPGHTKQPKRLLGHKIHLNDELSDKYVAYPIWTFSVPKGQDLVSVVPAAAWSGLYGKGGTGAASLGKVLGNRTTLYKYLSPRMVAVLTAPLGSKRKAKGKETCGVYVLDTVKGSVVYKSMVPAVGRTCDVKVSLVENWLVYHYYDGEVGVVPEGEGETKGWRVVSVELYEGDGVDDKTRSSDMSGYVEGNTKVLAVEQSYVFPHAITAMAPTTTRFGITTKDLIVANELHQIQSIQRLMLNPRRPNRKTTTEEQEEFLIPYEPVIRYDPGRVLSHDYEVANVRKIITAPALLESTSLVFAFGLDIFVTRVTPSGTFDMLSENFNKAQLVFTVLGLVVAIVVVRPMVKRKQLREKWY